MECPGIYFIASRFLDGSYIYKVGKSKCVKDRINQYPQNFSLIMSFKCLDKNVSENEVIGVLERMSHLGVVRCEKGVEYFTSENDLIKEIKLALYEWYYEIERTRSDPIESSSTCAADNLNLNTDIDLIKRKRLHAKTIRNIYARNHILIKELIPITKIEKRQDKTWLFLTYIVHDTPLTKEIIHKILTKRHATKTLISEEFGKEHGTKHHHCILYFGTRISFRHIEYFDIILEGKTIHPNIFDFSRKDMNAVIGYSVKEDPEPFIYGLDKEFNAYKALLNLEYINSIKS